MYADIARLSSRKFSTGFVPGFYSVFFLSCLLHRGFNSRMPPYFLCPSFGVSLKRDDGVCNGQAVGEMILPNLSA